MIAAYVGRLERMMKKLFDKDTGYLLLDEIVFERNSYQAILEDNVITDDEVVKQTNRVVELFKKLDEKLDQKEKELAVDAIAELAVLYQINALKGGR